MTEIQNIICILFVVTGILFMLAGSMGIVRLPDFYSRTHAAGTSDTLGVIFIILGLIIYEGLTLTSFKLLLISIFIVLANPIGTHALARAAYKRGLKPFFESNKENPQEDS